MCKNLLGPNCLAEYVHSVFNAVQCSVVCLPSGEGDVWCGLQEYEQQLLIGEKLNRMNYNQNRGTPYK